MRFHVPGIPHTVTNQQYISCAYTQKVYKLCSMLSKLGHEVYHYGCEGSNPQCTESVNVVTEEFRQTFYPTNYHTEQFRFDTNDKYHNVYYANAIAEIKKRQQPKDFLLCAWGWGHEPIARAFDNMLVVESGIGYESVFSKYRVFESYTWMAHVYGLNKIKNGAWYDAVIPNFFDPSDFIYSDKKEDWFLYLGRITQRKGVEIAVQTTKEIGAKLLIAGQGTLINEKEQVRITDSHVEHVGFADVYKRKELLSRAKAVFMPTYYIEPFGGVSIEAAMSGTPVISSDWGVFGENILHGVTGYRCRTFDHFCWAAENSSSISSAACRHWAIENFSMDRIALMYQEYFEMLYDLWDKGWYTRSKKRSQLEWLNKDYPSDKPDSKLKTLINSEISKPQRLAKIAFWTHTDWAFGRISESVKEIFKGIYQIEILDWSKETKTEVLESFDLIYIPTWSVRLEFLKRYPKIEPKMVVCGIHGVAELFNFDIQKGVTKKINIEELESFTLSKSIIEELSTISAIGVVNKLLLNSLKEKFGLSNLYLTECGVNTTKFKYSDSDYSEKKSIKVLYPVRIPHDTISAHGYDVKRFDLIKKIQENIAKEYTDIEFIIPDELISYDKMPEYYQKADVHLCVSHTEGGPLVALESAACGLIQISTPVGIVPDMFASGVSGYLINEKQEDKIIEQLNFYLRALTKNKSNLSALKRTTRKSIEDNWSWESKKNLWKTFFDNALSKL